MKLENIFLVILKNKYKHIKHFQFNYKINIQTIHSKLEHNFLFDDENYSPSKCGFRVKI
jgi:hypothetical protein